MYNVKNLICELAWVDVAPMSMVSYVWDVQGADMRNVWKTLEEMMLLTVSQSSLNVLQTTTYPIFVVDRHRQFSQVVHATTGYESQDFSIQHPSSPSRARRRVSIRSLLATINHQLLKTGSMSF